MGQRELEWLGEQLCGPEVTEQGTTVRVWPKLKGQHGGQKPRGAKGEGGSGDVKSVDSLRGQFHVRGPPVPVKSIYSTRRVFPPHFTDGPS